MPDRPYVSVLERMRGQLRLNGSKRPEPVNKDRLETMWAHYRYQLDHDYPLDPKVFNIYRADLFTCLYFFDIKTFPFPGVNPYPERSGELRSFKFKTSTTPASPSQQALNATTASSQDASKATPVISDSATQSDKPSLPEPYEVEIAKLKAELARQINSIFKEMAKQNQNLAKENINLRRRVAKLETAISTKPAEQQPDQANGDKRGKKRKLGDDSDAQ